MQCFDVRGIRYCFAFFFIFLISKVICKKVGLPKTTLFCLACPGRVKMWPEVVKLDMVRFGTSRSSCLSFFAKLNFNQGANQPGGNPQVRSRLAKQKLRRGLALQHVKCQNSHKKEQIAPAPPLAIAQQSADGKINTGLVQCRHDIFVIRFVELCSKLHIYNFYDSGPLPPPTHTDV